MFRPSRRACVITLLVLAVLDITLAGPVCRSNVFRSSRYIVGNLLTFSQFEHREDLMKWMAALTMISLGNPTWWARHAQSATEKDKKKRSKANARSLSCSTIHLVALGSLLRTGCWLTTEVVVPVKYFSVVAVVLGALGLLALKGNNQISDEEGSVLKKYYQDLALIYTGEYKGFNGTKYTFATLVLMAQCFSLGTPLIHALLNFDLLVWPCVEINQ